VVFAYDQGTLPLYKAVYIDDEADCYDPVTGMSDTCFDVYTKGTDVEAVERIAAEIYENKGYERRLVQFYFIPSDCVTDRVLGSSLRS